MDESCAGTSTCADLHIKTGPKAPSGQRIPLVRSEEELGENLNLAEQDWYGGVWVGPNPYKCQKFYTQAALDEFCRVVEDLQDTAQGVICVRFPVIFLTTVPGAKALSFLLTQTTGFEIWAAVPGEFIYSKWNGQGPSMFPPFATGIAGAGAVVVSPDGDKVALLENVSRAGFFDLPRGGREPGETLLETAERETEEETGLKRDSAVAARALYFHDQGAARDQMVQCVSDTHAVFSFRVLDTATKAQKTEVKRVLWFPIAPLVSGFKQFTESLDDKTKLPRSTKIGEDTINCSALLAISRYAMGQGSSCTTIGGYTTW